MARCKPPSTALVEIREDFAPRASRRHDRQRDPRFGDTAFENIAIAAATGHADADVMMRDHDSLGPRDPVDPSLPRNIKGALASSTSRKWVDAIAE